MKEKFKKLLQRESDYKETMKVLKLNPSIFFSWGTSKMYNVDSNGLILKVNGHHWKHYVLITLGWDDVYIVSLLNSDFSVHKTIKGVYVDMLTETIDKEIEYIEDYN